MIWLWAHKPYSHTVSHVLTVQKMSDDQIVALIGDMRFSCELDVLRANPDGITLEFLAEILGVTRERVRQIQHTTIEKLKKRVRWNRFKAYNEFKDYLDEKLGEDPYEEMYPDLSAMSDPIHARRWKRYRQRASNNRWQKYHEISKR